MRDTGVVIVAGGKGLRAAGSAGELKQFRWIAGKPMLLHSIQTFQSHPAVAMVVVVLPRSHSGDPPPWIFQCDLERMLISTGGDERVDSVRNGLEDLPTDLPIILVHDAARPFVPESVIDEVIRVARSGGVAVPGVPLVDTIKEVSVEGRVISTPPRDRYIRAQTPQGFPRDVLVAAHTDALRTGRTATDDAALCEGIGEAVQIIRGSELAMKVTTAEDFAVAEALYNMAVAEQSK